MSDIALAVLMVVLFSCAIHVIKKELKMNQQEAVAKLGEIKTQLDKVGTETQSLLDKVEELKAAAANAGDLSPELTAAIDAVAAQAKAVDDQVPDAA